MKGEVDHIGVDLTQASYADGRKAGLAIGALATAAAAFISLLGIEKAILALVLAILGFRGTQAGSRAKRLSLLAMLILCLYAVTCVTVLVLYHEKLAELFRLMQKLG